MSDRDDERYTPEEILGGCLLQLQTERDEQAELIKSLQIQLDEAACYHHQACVAVEGIERILAVQPFGEASPPVEPPAATVSEIEPVSATEPAVEVEPEPPAVEPDRSPVVEITPVIVAKALKCASDVRGWDEAACFMDGPLPKRVRILAGHALRGVDLNVLRNDVARALEVDPNTLAPSQLRLNDITEPEVAETIERLKMSLAGETPSPLNRMPKPFAAVCVDRRANRVLPLGIVGKEEFEARIIPVVLTALPLLWKDGGLPIAKDVVGITGFTDAHVYKAVKMLAERGACRLEPLVQKGQPTRNLILPPLERGRPEVTKLGDPPVTTPLPRAARDNTGRLMGDPVPHQPIPARATEAEIAAHNATIFAKLTPSARVEAEQFTGAEA